MRDHLHRPRQPAALQVRRFLPSGTVVFAMLLASCASSAGLESRSGPMLVRVMEACTNGDSTRLGLIIEVYRQRLQSLSPSIQVPAEISLEANIELKEKHFLGFFSAVSSVSESLMVPLADSTAIYREYVFPVSSEVGSTMGIDATFSFLEIPGIADPSHDLRVEFPLAKCE